MAMGATAHLLEERPAMDRLIQFYTRRCYDPDTRLPKPHCVHNLAEHLVDLVTAAIHS